MSAKSNLVQKNSEQATIQLGKDFVENFERYLTLGQVVERSEAGPVELYQALAHALRDLIAQRWIATDGTYRKENPKRVYYLSMEFLIGRLLMNNIINLQIGRQLQEMLGRAQSDEIAALLDAEPDAGLGNGGLGRLAACFIDSLATLGIPAMGYGLRYDYGIFRQAIENGYQTEYPDHWLARPDPWEVVRRNEAILINLNCSFKLENGTLEAVPGYASQLLAVPYDRPVVGFQGKTINTLRLWSATSPDYFNFGEFSTGDFVGAISERIVAETVTRVLYPDDSTRAGQALRFVQEYFLCCCSIGDILARFKRSNSDWRLLPQKVAIQLNDTHPAMSVAELMRALLDDHGLGWDDAWEVTVETLAYTNHTLLPEALEKWPVRFFEVICPRLLEIIYEIDRRFLFQVRNRFPADEERAQRMSILQRQEDPLVRMAHLAIVGCHSTNGVAQIHSDLLRTRVVSDFSELFPERFNNKTNGVTPRRWLLQANPELSALITEAIGDSWITNLTELKRLLPLAEDSQFRARFEQAKQQSKKNFAQWLKSKGGPDVNPESLFDSQIKRIHEYKRQLLNALHIVILYDRIRQTENTDVVPRTFFFAGKAAPAYTLAKLIIKLINNISVVVDSHPLAREKIKVFFLPNYNVSLAERLIPASELSEQISTAGYEASGTGNMKFMMNGALTIGTADGATIEMAEEAGAENFFLFGLSAEQVAESRSWYNPTWHYENDTETRRALDLIFNNHFSASEPGIFEPLREVLLDKGDYFMHLADLPSYSAAQMQVSALYRDRQAWIRKAIINVASSGKFSSDRTNAISDSSQSPLILL